MTFTSLLRPFYYEFPKIFSLPLEKIKILNSPVPLICGLNLSKKEYIKTVEKDNSIKTGEDTILVFLDFENYKFEYSKKIRNSFISPRIKEYKQKVKNAYDEFKENNENFKDKGDFVWTQDYKMGLLIAMTLGNGFKEMFRSMPDEAIYKDDVLQKVRKSQFYLRNLIFLKRKLIFFLEL